LLLRKRVQAFIDKKFAEKRMIFKNTSDFFAAQRAVYPKTRPTVVFVQITKWWVIVIYLILVFYKCNSLSKLYIKTIKKKLHNI
jgi:hypothetical protein